MEYHSIVSKISYVFDQYVYYKLVPEKGYSYRQENGELVITYNFVDVPPKSNISYEVYIDKKNQLFDFIRKAAKSMIKVDAYSKITIRQCNCDEEEMVEEIF